jgi:hypothetical protein
MGFNSGLKGLSDRRYTNSCTFAREDRNYSDNLFFLSDLFCLLIVGVEGDFYTSHSTTHTRARELGRIPLDE